MTSTIHDRVSRIIIDSAGIVPDQELTPDTQIVGAGLALDSVATVELLVSLEKEFGMAISPDELVKAEAFRTVGSLVEFIESHLPN